MVFLLFFKDCCLDITLRCWILVYIALKNSPASFQIPQSVFKLQVGIPSVFFRLPGHPVLKDLPYPIVVTKHLLHQGILIPKLINSWLVLASSLPHISRTINVLVAHLHVGIFQPQCHMLEVNRNCSLKHWTRPNELANARFPLSVFQPCSHMMLLSSQTVFEVLTHPILVIFQLVWVHNPNFGRPDVV